MTREEASDVLDDYDVNFAGHTAEEVAEAFDVAFKALEQESCEDAISRKEAISVMCSNCPDWQTCKLNCCRRKALENKKKLTSVYPEQAECEDCISRQAVLALAYDMSEIDGEHFTEPYMVVDVKDIQKLPSVTPAPKIGRWVFVKGYEGILYECTVCRNKNTHTTVRWNYCPHCGAKMEDAE